MTDVLESIKHDIERQLAEQLARLPKPHNVADDEPNPQDGMEDE